LAAGVPVVGINTGSLSELIGVDAGILIDASLDNTGTYLIDYADVANAIKKIVENYDFYSLNAKKRATEMFDIEIMSKKYIDLFL